MKAVLGGITVMVAIAIVAAVALENQFTTSASEEYSSPNNSVRLGE